MIAEVFAHNFKGATVKAPLGGLTLVVGPNGVGKSSRSQALQLAVLGYVPGTGKRNADIMDAFAGKGADLRVGIVLDSGTKVERRFSRSSRTGAVSQELYVGGVRVKPDEFARALAGVAVVDLSVFLGLSDPKKIDELFRLFPPDGDVRGVAEKIEQQTKRLNALERQELDATRAVATIQAQRSKIELPAGTLADKQNEIEQADADLRQARADLEAERIAAARADEQAQAAARQAEQPAPVAQAATLDPAPEEEPWEAPAGYGATAAPARTSQTSAQPRSLPQPLQQAQAPVQPGPDVTAVLQRILDTMERAGCSMCAARMVIKSELKKASQGQPREAA